MEKLRQLGAPLADEISPHQFTDFQAAFDPLLTPGVRNYWKSHNFTEINDTLIDVLIENVMQLPSAESEIFLAQMGGATNKINVEKTAYPHRNVEFIMNVHTRWDKPEKDSFCIGWARDFYHATKPYAVGGVYVNFVSEGDDSIENAYGHNAERLAKVKTQYDPDNALRSNLNIRPQK